METGTVDDNEEDEPVEITFRLFEKLGDVESFKNVPLFAHPPLEFGESQVELLLFDDESPPTQNDGSSLTSIFE